MTDDKSTDDASDLTPETEPVFSHRKGPGLYITVQMHSGSLVMWGESYDSFIPIPIAQWPVIRDQIDAMLAEYAEGASAQPKGAQE